MTIPAEKHIDMRIKHLEFIQALITRMAGYSATLKNYCVTVVTALAGLAFTLKDANLIGMAALAALAFAFLDTRYLQLERAYRTVYDDVRNENWESLPSFDLKPHHVDKHPFLRALWSWSVSGFYMPLQLVILVLFYVVRCMT